jgi:hypothetical protein
MSAPPANCDRCFTTAPARTTQAGPEDAVIAHDGSGLDHRAGADPAPVDHRPGSDHDPVLEHEIVVGQEVQHRVLEDLDVVADAHRAVRVADDLHAGADDRARTDDDVARYLGRREQVGGLCDGGHDGAVGVELPHGAGLRGRVDDAGSGGREREVAAPQAGQAAQVVGGRRAHDTGRAADRDGVVGQRAAGADERAFAEEDAPAEVGARHEH